uniref:FERM C-terminal PH-like domain-containing protein n=1 Tax=Timema shepardi TaxID=629360 RepID=A0A7R9FV95_TIMSH|nr:unnamed protein product [Timema shepardi]
MEEMVLYPSDALIEILDIQNNAAIHSKYKEDINELTVSKSRYRGSYLEQPQLALGQLFLSVSPFNRHFEELPPLTPTTLGLTILTSCSTRKNVPSLDSYSSACSWLTETCSTTLDWPAGTSGLETYPRLLLVLGEDNVEYFLGLTPSGIIVLRNKTKVGNYYWPRISKIYFKGRYFMLRVCDKNLYVGWWRGWEGNGTQPILPSARVKRGSKSPANLTACWREGSQTGLRDTSRKPEMKGSLYCYCRLRLQFCATWSRLGVPPLSVLPPSPQTPD